MEPTYKAPAIDAFMVACMGIDRNNSIRQGVCTSCKTFIGSPDSIKSTFRDEKSAMEFRISGLCQSCQDDVFGV